MATRHQAEHPVLEKVVFGLVVFRQLNTPLNNEKTKTEMIEEKKKKKAKMNLLVKGFTFKKKRILFKNKVLEISGDITLKKITLTIFRAS